MNQPVCVEIDGMAAATEGLRHRALVNYGHFTAMQVRDRCVRGLDLHLQRLISATTELFGTALTPDRVRELIRHALGDRSSASVRIDVHQPEPASGDVSVMVTVRPGAELPTAPQRLQTVRYQRPLPHIKHVGTFAQIYFGAGAERLGFDDALFLSADGHLLETTVANIGFIEEDGVVWPAGPMLWGITWQLLEQSLPALGMRTSRRAVRLTDLPTFGATFVTNSLGVAVVDRVAGVKLSVDRNAIRLIQEAYDAVPWDPV